MKHGYIKVATCTPVIKVGDTDFNANNIIREVLKAHESGVKLIVFPELSITGYTCFDLFLQGTLLENAKKSLLKIMDATKDKSILIAVGLPLASGSSIYNCGAVLQYGKILGIVPKKNLPNYSEFYEARHFTKGEFDEKVFIGENEYEITPNILFKCRNLNDFVIGIEICEDLWVCNSPSINLCQNGATVIANLSAGNEIIGKHQYRKSLVKIQSAKLICAYVYANAGFGESTTDVVFSSHNIICENGTVLSELKRYTNGRNETEIDVQKLCGERRKMTTFTQKNDNYKHVYFDVELEETTITRTIIKNPFVPPQREDLDDRCYEILTMQAVGLATRISNIGVKKVVLGLSGGLDSTLALIVCVNAFERLGYDLKDILTYTMPCFGTTKRTKSNAQVLAESYGVSFEQIDIEKSVLLHFEDIKQDINTLDITYENSQARERTQVLMDLANKNNAIVIGTGDLSELALGWATYNGDHMSMYAVNASVPKTLVRHLVKYQMLSSRGPLKEVLIDILNTPVSPELLPPKDGDITQKTEEIVGPYILHDFFIYYFVRFGFEPSKILRIAIIAFADEYEQSVIKQWLIVFLKRFFSQQFKRTCMPDSPKVGSVSLSTKSDFRMPSDVSVRQWIEELENN